MRRRKTLGVRMMPGGGVFLPMKRVVPLDAMAMVDDDLLSDAGAFGRTSPDRISSIKGSITECWCSLEAPTNI